MREDNEHSVLGRHANGGDVVLSDVDRRRHVYAIGKTGTGKSSLLLAMMRSDLQRGRGFALLDPHGDLAMAVAEAVPAGGSNDVIYVDPADHDFPVALNPLAKVHGERRPLVAAQVVAAFQHIWGNSWGPRLEYILLNSLRLLLDAPGSTLLGLPRVLRDAEYRRRLLVHTRDPVVKAFWTREFADYSERYATEAIAPIQNKVGTLLAPPALRNVLGQVRSTIDVGAIMDAGRVLIVNLAKGRLGEGPTHLLGAFLVTALAQAAEGRAAMDEEARRDFTLYADEFQNFATDSFAGILSEARKYRLSLVLAHQFLGQLPPLLRQAVLGNAGSIIAFRVGAEDSASLAAELGIENELALADTANFHAWIKLMRNGVPSEPLPFRTLTPGPAGRGQFQAIRNRTRARYARPRQIVEAKIERFLNNEL